jgi:hypothetical protein
MLEGSAAACAARRGLLLSVAPALVLHFAAVGPPVGERRISVTLRRQTSEPVSPLSGDQIDRDGNARA